MRFFTAKEVTRLDTINPNLVKVIMRAKETLDFYIVCGHRDQHDQDLAVASGHSKVKFPNSKHNKSVYPTYSSDAVDLCPFPIDWNDMQEYILFCPKTNKLQIYSGQFDVNHFITVMLYYDVNIFYIGCI